MFWQSCSMPTTVQPSAWRQQFSWHFDCFELYHVCCLNITNGTQAVHDDDTNVDECVSGWESQHIYMVEDIETIQEYALVQVHVHAYCPSRITQHAQGKTDYCVTVHSSQAWPDYVEHVCSVSVIAPIIYEHVCHLQYWKKTNEAGNHSLLPHLKRHGLTVLGLAAAVITLLVCSLYVFVYLLTCLAVCLCIYSVVWLDMSLQMSVPIWEQTSWYTAGCISDTLGYEQAICSMEISC